MGRKRRAMRNQLKFVDADSKKNELFDRYYQGQKGLIPENEWEDFMKSMQSDLPSTFRVTGFREHSRELLFLLRNKFLDNLLSHPIEIIKTDEIKKVVEAEGDGDGVDIVQTEEDKQEGQMDDDLEGEGEEPSKIKTEERRVVGPPTTLQWYPEGLAWQLNASRVDIRRSIELKRLHQFLVSETEMGYISRQEAVSMLPPLLLDVQSHHRILDMCAAPGSKTAQIVELLHAGCPSGGREVPSGVVVANDVDSKRCYLMIHQVARVQSPCVLITRQDATIYPRLFVPNPEKPGEQMQLVFDRILADAPCSGDGTLRKNPDIWPRWSPNQGLSEHFLQMKILRRSLELLAVGGRMVYSTCSLNPVEDEAVVGNTLSQCGSSVRLVDVSSSLPGLKFCRGLDTWRVMLKDEGLWCDTYEDIPDKHRRSVRPTMFPPADTSSLHLDRCMRILPHQQNTGGFFIAVLEKVDRLPWMKARAGNVTSTEETDTPAAPNGVSTETADSIQPAEDKEPSPLTEPTTDKATTRPDSASSGAPPRKRARVFREDPFIFMDAGDPEWEKLRTYYDLDASFPQEQLMFRCAQSKRKNLYFVNLLAKQIVETNASRGINFVNMGVKLFSLTDDKKDFAGYRLLNEGVEILDGWVGAHRRLQLYTKEDVVTLLTYDTPFKDQFSEETVKSWEKLSVGPVLVEYIPPKSESEASSNNLPRCRLVIAAWRGKVTIRHSLCNHGRGHVLRLCGYEPETPLRAPRRGAPNLEDFVPDDSSD